MYNTQMEFDLKFQKNIKRKMTMPERTASGLKWCSPTNPSSLQRIKSFTQSPFVGRLNLQSSLKRWIFLQKQSKRNRRHCSISLYEILPQLDLTFFMSMSENWLWLRFIKETSNRSQSIMMRLKMAMDTSQIKLMPLRWLIKLMRMQMIGFGIHLPIKRL